MVRGPAIDSGGRVPRHLPETPLPRGGTFFASLSGAAKSADNLLSLAHQHIKTKAETFRDEWEQEASKFQARLSETLCVATDSSGAAGARLSAADNHVRRDKDLLARTDVRRSASTSALRQGHRTLSEQQTSEVYAALQNLHLVDWYRHRAPRVTFSPSLREQAQVVINSDTAKKTAAVASTLLSAPKKTIASCAQTLENCHENFQTLGSLLQQTVERNIASVPRASTVDEDGAACGKPNTIFTTSSDVRAIAPLPSPSTLIVSAEKLIERAAEDILTPWSSISRAMRAREVEAIEKVVAGNSSWEDEELAAASLSTRPLGPLQKQALERRRNQRRKKQGSSLREPGRKVAIYTTAALPWMTGTAVNPLLRAAYLAKDEHREVTLVIPWLAAADQHMVFPNNTGFETPEQQEEYVRGWARKRTGLPCNFKIKFYPGHYAAEKCSILPVGDPTQYISDSEADIAVLEEPEHLNWYHHGRRWTEKFNHVVGVMHTNYLDYAKREEHGVVKSAALAVINHLMCRLHCHKVVKLSDAVQRLPRETTQFVHGVPGSFLEVGEQKARQPEDGCPRFSKGAYFIGKAIWAKGYTELLDLLSKEQQRGANPAHVDCYGAGEDLDELRRISHEKHLALAFHGARDHLDRSIHDYRVFVNPSTSDVVATTTAEALAMGKWVVVHDLPCNAFFSSFKNCLTYRTPEEFSERLRFALSSEPHPLSNEDRQRLTWEAATERFLDVSELRPEERAGPVDTVIESAAYSLVKALNGTEAFRAIAGAGVNTRDNPPSVTAFTPVTEHAGGFFDNKERARARAAKVQASRNPWNQTGYWEELASHQLLMRLRSSRSDHVDFAEEKYPGPGKSAQIGKEHS